MNKKISFHRKSSLKLKHESRSDIKKLKVNTAFEKFAFL